LTRLKHSFEYKVVAPLKWSKYSGYKKNEKQIQQRAFTLATAALIAFL
jgi:hypothetical protein